MLGWSADQLVTGDSQLRPILPGTQPGAQHNSTQSGSGRQKEQTWQPLLPESNQQCAISCIWDNIETPKKIECGLMYLIDCMGQWQLSYDHLQGSCGGWPGPLERWTGAWQGADNVLSGQCWHWPAHPGPPRPPGLMLASTSSASHKTVENHKPFPQPVQAGLPLSTACAFWPEVHNYWLFPILGEK